MLDSSSSSLTHMSLSMRYFARRSYSLVAFYWWWINAEFDSSYNI